MHTETLKALSGPGRPRGPNDVAAQRLVSVRGDDRARRLGLPRGRHAAQHDGVRRDGHAASGDDQPRGDGVVVRPPALDPALIGRLLDAGASGIICPMVSSVEEAQLLVTACRYPPVGNRSIGPIRARLLFGDDYVAKSQWRGAGHRHDRDAGWP